LVDGVKMYAAFAFEKGENIGVVHYRQSISNYDAAERKATLYCSDCSSPIESKIRDTGEESNEEDTDCCTPASCEQIPRRLDRTAH
jgi:hypothetical protein